MSTTDQRTGEQQATTADAGAWAVPGVDRVLARPEASTTAGAVHGDPPTVGSSTDRAAGSAVPGRQSADEPGPDAAAESERVSAAAAEEEAAGWRERFQDTTSATSGGHVHPVIAAVATCLEALDGIREAGVATLSARELRLLLLAVAHLAATAFALKLRLLVAAETQRVADLAGAASTATFLAHLTRSDRPDAATQVRLARDLDTRYRLLGDGLAAGALSPEQLRVCVPALRRLPKDLPTEKVEECQRFLLHCAATMTPRQLRVVGRRLWEVIDPDGAEAKDGKDLQDEEERARARACFTSWRNGDGTTGFRGKLPDAHADILLKILHALAAPRRRKNPNIPTNQPDNITHPGATTGQPEEPGPGDTAGNRPGSTPRNDPSHSGPGNTPTGTGPHGGTDPAPGPDGGTDPARGPDCGADGGTDSGDPLGPGDRAAPGVTGGEGVPPGAHGCDGSPRDRCLDDTSAEEHHTGKTIPYPVRLGHALIDLIERIPADAIPDTGGIAATIVVTLRADQLTTALGAATLDTGTPVSAAQARRWACQAGLVPIVLDGDSQPLDVGREQRLHTKAMRLAVHTRQAGTCASHGCDQPITDLHHPHAWSKGGHTSLANALGLCRYHHHLAHHAAWTLTHHHDRWTFQRRSSTC